MYSMIPTIHLQTDCSLTNFFMIHKTLTAFIKMWPILSFYSLKVSPPFTTFSDKSNSWRPILVGNKYFDRIIVMQIIMNK